MDPGNTISLTQEDMYVNETANSSKPTQSAETKVKVAVRVRPFIPKEIIENEESCIQCYYETNQVAIGKDKVFKFDNVFDSNSRQEQVYESCAKDLVASCLAGYNATILAYGQTGSGKTYTMGSNTTYDNETNNSGIIPRVMKELFNEIEKRKAKSEFILRVCFLEIYNEEIQDLLDTTSARFRHTAAYYNKNPIAIREEKDGSISVFGAKEEKVSSFEEMTAYLEKGSLQRSTASTLMNETSSRSHAIFTISVEQHQIDDLYKKNVKAKTSGETNFTMAKFHFVDLAGSERIKKTGASGSILREGININRGLLALGNVISALTDLSGKISHVPYRESKLTRILQDSLGGNSRTVMIACVSPAASNFEESLNTLKYASRARNIKNKPVVNRDPQSTLVSQLKQQVFELQSQLLNYKRILSSKENFPEGSQALTALLSGSVSFAEPDSEEMNILKDEVKDLKIRLIQREKELAMVTSELQHTKMSLNQSEISVYSLQKERDLLKLLSEKYKKVLDENNLSGPLGDPELEELEKESLIEGYSKTIEKLQQELKDKQKMNEEIQREYESLLKSSARDEQILLEKTKIIQSLINQLKLQETSTRGLEKVGTLSQIDVTVTERTETLRTEEDFEGHDPEDDEIDKEIQLNSQLHKKEMLLVDGKLSEKEELLQNMTKNQFLLEKSLLEEMKKQYYKKSLQLENEVKFLEKQRDEALSKINNAQLEGEKNKIVTTYKQKISELEIKIKEFKKKEKDQHNIMKLVESQRSKIQHLDDEIKKIKIQKNQLQKKIREEAEKYEKWKGSRDKELLDAKKKNIEKDLVISKLKTENKKKDFIYKKKAEELLAKYMSKELLGQIQSETQKRKSILKRRRTLCTSVSYADDSNNLSFDDVNLSVMAENDARQLIDYCSERMVDHLQISYQIEKEEENLRKAEEELEVEKNKYAELVLKRDRTDLEKKGSIKDIDLEQSLSLKLEELNLELNETSTRIESLEAKLDFQINRMNQLTDQLAKMPKTRPEELLLHNEKIWKNTNNMKLILRCLFGNYITASLDIVKLHERLTQYVVDMTEMKRKMEDIDRKAKFNELQYEISLTKLTKEYEKNQLMLLKEQSYDENEEIAQEDPNNMTDLERIETENNFGDIAQNYSELTSPLYIDKGGSQISLDRSINIRRGSTLAPDSPTRKRPIVNSASGSKGKESDSLIDQNKKLEKMVQELRKKNTTNEKVIDDLRRKCGILQTKYDQLKKTMGGERASLQKNGSDDIAQTRALNINNNTLVTDRSQYSTNTSMSINSSFSGGLLGNIKKTDENELSARNKQEKPELKNKGLLSLAGERERRKEERDKNKQSVLDTSSTKIIYEEKESKLKSAATTELSKSSTDPKLKFKRSVTMKNKRPSSPTKKLNTTIEIENGLKKSSSNLLITSFFKLSKDQNEIIEESKLSDIITKDLQNEGESLKTSFDEDLKESWAWSCHASIEPAHNSPIYGVTSLGNMLYSSGHKTFKVWSLDTLTCISEIMAHPSAIKAITIWPEKNLLATACDKVVSLWDLVSLQNVGTLRGHKDEIKTLAVCDNFLLSGGKGSSTYGSLLAWDLRSHSPIEEKEKDQEISSMVTHNGILYYGNQSHQIRSINLSSMQSLAPFEPSHKDAVSSMTIIKDHLVSASKDKTLNLWNLEHHVLNLDYSYTYPKGHVSALESNITQDLMYSGSKNGVIRVWNLEENKLNCLNAFSGHKQSINSICKLYDEYETMFATASSDRNIKIWKPKEEEDSEILQKADETGSKSQDP